MNELKFSGMIYRSFSEHSVDLAVETDSFIFVFEYSLVPLDILYVTQELCDVQMTQFLYVVYNNFRAKSP